MTDGIATMAIAGVVAFALCLALLMIRVEYLSSKVKFLEKRSLAQQDMWMDQVSINEGTIRKLGAKKGDRPWLGRN